MTTATVCTFGQCWLYEGAGYVQELKHTVVHADPQHPKHAQWAACVVSIQNDLNAFPPFQEA